MCFFLSSLLFPNKVTASQQHRSVGSLRQHIQIHTSQGHFCRGLPLLSTPPTTLAQGDYHQEGRYLLPSHTNTWSHFPATLYTSFSAVPLPLEEALQCLKAQLAEGGTRLGMGTGDCYECTTGQCEQVDPALPSEALNWIFALQISPSDLSVKMNTGEQNQARRKDYLTIR